MTTRSTFTISDDVMSVLMRSRLEPGILFLPPGQLDRKLYEAVNKVLAGIGMQWHRHKKGHVFDDDAAAETFENVLVTGAWVDQQKLNQFYQTPFDVAQRLIALADLPPAVDKPAILEPSAGRGAIIMGLHEAYRSLVTAVEIDPQNIPYLHELNPALVLERDFLTLGPGALGLFDRILMNPPFARQQDIVHVTHAMKLLKPGGVLVSVMSPGFTFRTDKRSSDFGVILASGDSHVAKLLPGSFKESGTMVNAVLVQYRRRP